MFRRSASRDDDAILRAYATTSDVAPGDPSDWPERDADAAARHAGAYEGQREKLQADLTRSGQADELFVARCFAMRRSDGGAHTYATWTEGILTLLPAADVILLVEQPTSAESKPTMTWVRWDVAAHVCADTCWKVMPEFKPPRILTKQWLSQDQLDTLKSRQLPPTRA